MHECDGGGLLASTDGNLSVHARRLEEAGYVSCSKTFEERKPRSTRRLTPLTSYSDTSPFWCMAAAGVCSPGRTRRANRTSPTAMQAVEK